MKKKHLKNVMSVTLAVAMLSSTLVGSVANASIIVNDDTGTGSASVETDDSVTVDSSTDGIVTTDDGIKISTEQKNLISSVKVADDGIELEDDNGLKAGSKVTLSASAENKLDESVKFKLYFWNYSENTDYQGMLNSVPEKLTVKPDVATITDENGTEVESKATFIQDKDGDNVTASYVLVELPANSKLSLNLDASNEVAGKVAAVPYLENTENSACGDSVCIDWEEDGIQVDTDIVVNAQVSNDIIDSAEENDGITIDSNSENSVIVDSGESNNYDISDLNKVDFSSKRLVVLSDDDTLIRKDDTLLGKYDSIYLLEYSTVDDAMQAYQYYKQLVQAVEPDVVMNAASDDIDDDDSITMDDDVIDTDNPISVLNNTADLKSVQNMENVIALLDTGVSESTNVIDRVSLIDDVMDGNGHGDDMLQAIVDQNENANILSIRVMDNDGHGSVSSIIAGMEYAINQNVKIINLSLSARLNLANSVLQEEIEKAVDAGITVVAAAGNDGKDVKDYMPGSVDAAYVIGACNESGMRLHTSNYGDTVDYNVVANTTSEAAAKFSGWVSTGWKYTDVNNGFIYDTDYESIQVESDGEQYSVNVNSDSDYSVHLDHADGIYTSGDKVTCTVDAPDDVYVGINALKTESNAKNTGELMYCEVKSEDESHTYSFIMPNESVDLKVYFLMTKDDTNSTDDSATTDSSIDDDIMTIAANGTGVDNTNWYYRSDGQLHPFWNAMGSGGNDSYKFVSYTDDDGGHFEVMGYCMQHTKFSPPSGTTYPFNQAVELKTKDGDDVYLRKAIFYGYGGPGWNKTLNGQNIYNIMVKYGCPADTMRAMQHYIVDYLYDGESGFGGALSDQAKNMIYAIKNALAVMPDPVRDRKIQPSLNTTVTTENGVSRTNTLTWKADDEFLLYITCGSGMQVVNETTNTVVKSGKATIRGGQKFHLEATGVTGSKKYRVTSNFPLDYHAMVLKFDGSTQDIGFGYRTNGKYYLNVTWPDKAKLTINKRFWCAPIAQASSRYGNLKATFTVFSDKACQKPVGEVLIDGGSERYSTGSILLNPGLYYVKETTRIKGTVINDVVYGPVRINNGDDKNLADYIPASERTLKNMDDKGWVLNKPIFYTGLILKKKDADKDIYLKDAVFKINYSEDADPFKVKRTWYFVTDEHGQIKYSNSYLADNNPKFAKKYKSDALFNYSATDVTKVALPLCTLHIKEVEAPDGYARDNTMYTVHVMPTKATSGSEKWDYTVQNAVLSKDLVIKDKPVGKKWKIQVQAKKIDKNGKGLAGAVFAIYDDPDCKGEPLFALTTDKTGMSNIESYDKIDWDNETYDLYAKEVKAPKGFVLLKNPIKMTYKRSDYEALEKKDSDTKGKLEIFGIDSEGGKNGIVNDEGGWKVRVNAKKIDADNVPLENAKFGFYWDEDCKQLISEETTDKEGFTKDVTVSVENDKDSFTIWCKELDAPDGYVKSDEKLSVTFEKAMASEEGELLTVGPFVNKQAGWQVRVNAKKVNKALSPLSGAVFGVFKDSKCEDDSFVGNLISGADGMTDILTVPLDKELDSITLYCKELEAPENCVPTDERFELTFTKQQYDDLKASGDTTGPLGTFGPKDGIINDDIPTPSPTPTPTVTPTPPTGAGVHVKKVSTAEDDIMDLHGYTLKGAKFHIYGGEAGDGNRGDSRVDTYVTTDESGYSETVSLPDPSWYEYPSHTDSNGNTIYDTPILHPVTTVYTITEVEPPHGHKMAAPKSQQFSVTMPYDKDKVFEKVFTDEPKFTKKSLQLDKVSSKGNPINGVVFKVEFFDTELEGVNYDADATTYALDDEDYAVTMDADEDVGVATLEAEEDSMEVDTIDVQSLPDSELVVMSSNGGSNSIKTDSEAKITDEGMSGTPTRTWYLQSDEKGLVLMDDDHVCRLPQYKSDPFYKHNNQIVIPLYGTLQITEEKCPAEYIKCDEILQFPTTENGDLSARIYNDLEPCKVNIKKFKEDGKTAIAGVEFEIKFVKQSEGFTSKQREYKRLLKEGETVTRSTDWEGNCYFDQLDQGDYEITEIKTASGQTLLKDPIKFSIPFKMTEDEANEYQDINYESAREDTDYTNKWFFYECSYIITNTPVFDLPHTGATGTWNYGFVGLGIALAAGVGTAGTVVTKRRRRKKQNK